MKGTMETGVNGEIWAMLDSQGTELAELTLIGQKNEGILLNVNTNLGADFYSKIVTSFKNLLPHPKKDNCEGWRGLT